MPFLATSSTLPETQQALDAVCSELQSFDGPPDLMLAFYSIHHQMDAELLASTLQERIQPKVMLGCAGESIVCNDQEIENQPALSVWIGRWSSSPQLVPFHLTFEKTSEGLSILGWPDDLVTMDPNGAILLTLGDPFSFPTDVFLDEVNNAYKGARVLGGMASGAQQPGQCRFLFNGEVLEQGAIGAILPPQVKARSVVSQGCRPIGQPFVITKAQENIILDLGGHPAVAQLQKMWQTMSSRDQELFQEGPHVGRVINEYQDKFERGDFLVRNVIGLDPNAGALAITDHVRVGQTVQFHVRDAEAADEDLRELLQSDGGEEENAPSAGLLFSCNGRGTRMFSEPHHDASAIRQQKGPIPLAGFFAAGELGPIGGQNFIHGFTASVVLFDE